MSELQQEIRETWDAMGLYTESTNLPLCAKSLFKRANDNENAAAALREEVKKLTLLSDSQLANQEKMVVDLAETKEARELWRDNWFKINNENAELRAELSTLKANQERLVGENQELRQVVEDYRYSPSDHSVCMHLAPCPICIKAKALLAPKDTPTEPTQEK
jgi:hypothetical protein